MPVSSTSNYNLTGTELVNSVFRLLGVYGIGETVPADDTTNALQALNILLKSLQKRGIQLWTKSVVNITPVAGQTMYQIGPAVSGSGNIVTHKPIRVLEAYFSSSSDRKLEMLPMQRYYLLGYKSQAGTPTSVYVDHQRDQLDLYFYPVPTTADTTKTISIVSQRTILDVDTAADNIDIPQEWFQALKWQLAAELGPEYGVDLNRQQMIEQKAASFLADSTAFDEELESSVFFGVSQK